MATRIRRNKRLWVSVPPEHDTDLEEWAKRMGVTKSTLVSMTSQAGLKQLIRMMFPEKAFKPEEWADITEAMVKKGFAAPIVPTRKTRAKVTRAGK
jgi:hypothetical protein